MRIVDLLEGLQKFNEENIEFMIFDKDGESPRKLELFISDSRFLYRWMNNKGKPTNTIILGLMEDSNSSLGANNDA